MSYCKDGDSNATYVRAIHALTFAWILCTPYDVANVQAFCVSLTSFTMKQRKLEATWKSLSEFHAEIFRKIDEESEKYVLNESTISRASPQTAWIDHPSRYLQTLQARQRCDRGGEEGRCGGCEGVTSAAGGSWQESGGSLELRSFEEIQRVFREIKQRKF